MSLTYGPISCPAGAFVDSRVDSVTPLMAAASQGRLQCARLLLDRGADPNATDEVCASHMRLIMALLISHPVWVCLIVD